METSTIIAVVVVIAFFVLALVAIFRFDKVKNTFEGLGFKFGITGSKARDRKNIKQNLPKDIGKSTPSGKASIKIGGKVANSTVSAKGSTESDVNIKKDVDRSKIHSEGGK